VVSFRPKLRTGPFLQKILDAPLIYNATCVFLVVKGRLKQKMRWVEKESVIEFLSGTVAMEGYMQFEPVVSV
jgi:hypothetical protein